MNQLILGRDSNKDHNEKRDMSKDLSRSKQKSKFVPIISYRYPVYFEEFHEDDIDEDCCTWHK
jgi:hypothetical protein